MRTWLLLTLLGCPSQVGIISQETPNTAAAGGNAQSSRVVPTPAAQGPDLEEDEQVVEPDHPAVKTPQERALTHIHTPAHVCTGVVIGPKLVATAHQCFPPEVSGVYRVPSKDMDGYHVEIASSTLTWTTRKVMHVVAPACPWRKLDVAIVVLDEGAPALAQPVSVTSAPGPGGAVQALGFGKCRGDDKPFSGRTGSVIARRDRSIAIDVVLCQGDVGGPVFDTSAGGYIGVISGRGEAGNDRERTAIIRFDTSQARALVSQASAIAKNEAPAAPVTCD